MIDESFSATRRRRGRLGKGDRFIAEIPASGGGRGLRPAGPKRWTTTPNRPPESRKASASQRRSRRPAPEPAFGKMRSRGEGPPEPSGFGSRSRFSSLAANSCWTVASHCAFCCGVKLNATRCSPDACACLSCVCCSGVNSMITHHFFKLFGGDLVLGQMSDDFRCPHKESNKASLAPGIWNYTKFDRQEDGSAAVQSMSNRQGGGTGFGTEKRLPTPLHVLIYSGDLLLPGD